MKRVSAAPVIKLHRQAFHQIRAFERQQNLRKTPIIAVTANAMSHQIQAYRDVGFDGHVSKPIKVEDILATMSACVERSERAAS